MRTFDHPNTSHGWTCPVCRTAADRPVTLVAIPGTEEDGIAEADQVHVACYERVVQMVEAQRGEVRP